MSMANKKVNEIKDGDVLANIVVLRSTFGKVGQKVTVQPQKDKHGNYPKSVRKIDSNGDMILQPGDEMNLDNIIPENAVIELRDGSTFNLDNPRQAAEWEAIRHCFLIAEDRYAKDSAGNYLIDGTTNTTDPSKARYGMAMFYIDHPGKAAQIRLTRAKLELKAQNFIINDPEGYDGLLRKAKVLGRNMSNMPSAEVEEYLISVAKMDPQKIIDLYTDSNLSLRLLLITAKEKGIIKKVSGIYFYGEDTAIGSSEDGVIDWMNNPKNKKTLELIRQETTQSVMSE